MKEESNPKTPPPAPPPQPPPSQGPHCAICGGGTVRAGTCYVCMGCGTTTGCS